MGARSINSTSAAVARPGRTSPGGLTSRAARTAGSFADSAPISGYSWLMVYTNEPDKTKGTALVDFLYWIVTDGQQYAVNLHYAHLPSNMVTNDIASLKTVTYGGSALLSVSS